MLTLRTRAEVRAHRQGLPSSARIGLVPTMGALHEGHLSLVAQARSSGAEAWATIFVNPLQFGATEDLSKYPRPFERDVNALKAAGCSVLFAPDAIEMYRADASTYVVEQSVSGPLCGEFRPGHFKGVTTVVLKLFNLIQPQDAYFGQKDAQQCAVIERMVRDLEVPVRLHRGATVREADGLAMSSRNVYLSPAERALAPLIHRALEAVQAEFSRGEKDIQKLQKLGRSFLQEPSFRIQYLEIRDSATLMPVQQASVGATVFVAAYLGSTRLIDNRVLI